MGKGIRGLLALALILGALPAFRAAAQGAEDEFIARLLAQMPPEAKVGQLFLVTLPGPIARPDHPLRALVVEQRVAGVLLSPEQGNFANVGDTPAELLTLTRSLQGQVLPLSPFIPLFIGLRQQGDGPPTSAWTAGAMPLPSPLALGATWDPEQVRAVGRALGEEFRAVGLNLLLGPPLEVLMEPRPDLGDAGAQTFGGDPYWVARMARAYVEGVREGSGGRLLVVPGAFPGEGQAYGRGERLAVRTLEDLAAFDLVPFLALMRTPADAGRPLVQAVQVSTMRVRGFRGSAQEWTRPLAVDGEALGALVGRAEVKVWREGGGVLLSPPLGHPALRALYADEKGGVDFRRAALEAFLAGNDLLWLGDLHSDPQEAARQAASVIAFFREKYSTDLSFQNLVNAAVARILRLKYRLYPGFTSGAVFPTPRDLRAAPGAAAHGWVVRQALEKAVVRLRPTGGAPPPVPGPDAFLLVLVDGRTARACAACPEVPLLPPSLITQALRVAGAGVLDPERIVVRTFAEAMAFLARRPEAPDLRTEFERANWVVIAALEERPDDEASSLPHVLLGERADLLAGKQVVFWGFGGLYPLTPREVARLTRYEAIWTRVAPAVEVMARVLFGAVSPRSRAPLSIPAVGYVLAERLRPDPNQVIPLGVGLREGATSGTPTPVAVRVGETLRVWAGPIYDRDGYPVPDGTPVLFTGVYTGQGTIGPFRAGTREGFAEVDIPLDREGMLEIRAASEPARLSYRLQIQIERNRPGRIATVVPPTPTRPPEPTTTALPPAPMPTPRPGGAGRSPRVGWGFFAVSNLLIVGAGAVGFGLGRRRGLDRAWQAALSGAAAGWVAYALLVFGRPAVPIPMGTVGLPLAAGIVAFLVGGGVALLPSDRSGG